MRLFYVFILTCFCAQIEAAECSALMDEAKGCASINLPDTAFSCNEGLITPVNGHGKCVPTAAFFAEQKKMYLPLFSDGLKNHPIKDQLLKFIEELHPTSLEDLNDVAALLDEVMQYNKVHKQVVDVELAPLSESTLFKRRQKKAQEEKMSSLDQPLATQKSVQEKPQDRIFLHLVQAIQTGNLTKVKILVGVDKGVVKRCDKDGWTPLHWAVFSKNEVYELPSGVLYRMCNKDIVVVLVEAGADVNKATRIVQDGAGFVGGSTPLSLAAHNCTENVFMHLVFHGANPMILDGMGQCPLDIIRDKKPSRSVFAALFNQDKK